MDKVSGDIDKMMQACIAAQENAGKLIENVISQALTKSTRYYALHNPAMDSRTF